MEAAELAIELTRQQIINEGNFDSVEELFAGTVSLRDKAAAKLAALKADPDKAGSTELAQAEALDYYVRYFGRKERRIVWQQY